jgi:hypothetical protein
MIRNNKQQNQQKLEKVFIYLVLLTGLAYGGAARLPTQVVQARPHRQGVLKPEGVFTDDLLLRKPSLLL